MRTVPPYSHQADLWLEMLKKLDYRDVIFVHSSDINGQSTLHRFQSKAGPAKVKIEHVIEYLPGAPNVSESLLYARDHLNCRVYILYANQEDAAKIFKDLLRLDMISDGFAWLVTEQALNAPNRIDGLLGPVLINARSVEAHVRDSVNIIAMALRTLFLEYSIGLADPPSNCSNTDGRWETGLELMKILRNQTLSNGATGRVSFDENYDRLESQYSIVNVQQDQLVEVGNYTYSDDEFSMQLGLDLNNVVWPGGRRSRPHPFFIDRQLRIATIVEEPFIWAREMPNTGVCDRDEVNCTHYDAMDEQGKTYCCKGYCIDMLVKLSEEMGFVYDLYIVFDRRFGIFDHQNGTKRWSGLVGELVHKKADMVVAPLTINPERAKVIDFSKPFKYQGITMLQMKMPKGAKLDSFLQPFQHNLWLLVMLSVHVVAVVLYLLDRFSPLGKFGQMLPDLEVPSEERALTLSSAILFAWGVLLNSGIGDKAPKSFSARVLGMVWAGFAMIVVASYTANLAAFLVLEEAESEITGLDDARLRNPVDGFNYATVRGSSVDEYFRDQVELSNMYRVMEDLNRETAAEAIEAVREGKLNVFFWDSPRLEYEAAKDCNLIISTETFGRSGYGIGLQKNSFWTQNVTLSILNMHESGFMESLDNKWILKGDQECEKEIGNFPTTLGLTNMAGVFILVAAGIIAGFFFVPIEIYYKRQKAKRMRNIALARRAADRWIAIVRKRKKLRCPVSTRHVKPKILPVQRPAIEDMYHLPPQLDTPVHSITPPPLPFKRTFRDPREAARYGTVMKSKTNQNCQPYFTEQDMIEPKTKLPQGVQMNPVASDNPIHCPNFRTLRPTMCQSDYEMNKTLSSLPSSSSNSNLFNRNDPDVPPPPPPPMISPRVKSSQPVTPYIRGGKGFFVV
ncbi:glutamate [NMDA] receptor subunit 1-like isoform X2 [Brevipalpus obovatus]